MDFIEKARLIENNLTRRMTGAARNLVQTTGTREPLELVRTILEAIEREIQSSGRGTRVFPFNTIEVSVLAPSDQARARLEAIVDGDVPLQERLAERLRTAGCGRTDLAVSINYVPRTQKSWTDPQFSIAFSRIARKPADSISEPARPPARLEMTVVHGKAERKTYSFGSQRVDLGRGVEVRDSRTGLIRTNHVAFSEGTDERSRSVSRQHAHVTYEPRSGHFRLHDDGSVHGTKIQRNGKTLPVHRDARGVRLQPGDDIVLGDARVRVAFDLERLQTTKAR